MGIADDHLIQIKERLGKKTTQQISEELSIPFDSLRWIMRKNGLSNPVPWERPWKEVQAIAQHASKHPIRLTSEKFGVSVSVVKNMTKRYKDAQLEYVRKLTPDQVELKRRMAILYGRKRGLAEYAEDFGSYVVIQILSKGRTHLEYLYPDFCRIQFGSSKSRTGLREQQATRKGVDLDDPAVIQLPSEKFYDVQSEFETLFVESGLAPGLRAVFMLTYLWEFTLLEIAFLFDESAENVRQQVLEIDKHLADKLLLKEE